MQKPSYITFACIKYTPNIWHEIMDQTEINAKCSSLIRKYCIEDKKSIYNMIYNI